MELIERVRNLAAETVMLRSCLVKEVKSLKPCYHLVKNAPKNLVIISGIPTDCNDSSQRIVNRVFSALHTSGLSNEIKAIRMINSDSTVSANDTRSPNRGQFLLLIVMHLLLRITR